MLTREDDVDAHKLHAKGWTISAIARHLGHDRKTIRAYLAGDRVAGERVRAGDDRFEKFVDYVRARLVEDPHLWATTLLDELEPLGYDQSYQSLTRQIRARGLRPVCTACAHVTKRPNAVIASTVTFVVLLVFLAVGIASLVRARRYRAQQPTNAPA